MSRQSNQHRGIDSITILSGAVSVMLTLPLAPKVVNATSDMTYRALVQSYGSDLASWGMFVHAGASFVMTFFALLIVLQIALRLFISEIGRLSRRTNRPNW